MRNTRYRQYVLAFAVVFLMAVAALSDEQPTRPYKASDGYVPDAATAIKIAKAVLTPVYGEKTVVAERPFKAQLNDGVWTVNGTLHCPNGDKMCFGGGAEVKLAKDDARILSMIVYK